MYQDPDSREVFVRIPKCGTTAYLAANKRFEPLGGDDHEFYSVTPQTRKCPVVAVIRHPYDWCYSLYNMCVRASPHWFEHVEEPIYHLSDPINFVWGLKHTPLDWLEGAPSPTILRIEDLNLERLNPTKAEDRKGFCVSGELEAAMRLRFARELELYPPTL
jgi:hypothetical protein